MTIRTGSTFVPPIGDPQAPIVLVGEQPGKMEVRNRQPFIGPAGRVLMDCMQVVDVVRHDCYITNVIKDLDHPLETHFRYDKGKMHVSSSWYKYLEILKMELEQTSGVIVAIGNVALAALTGNLGITKWRGSVLESTLVPGRKVVPIFHPATVIPPKNQYLNKILIQFDLKRVKDVADGKFQESKYEIIIRPTYQQVIDYLEECYEYGLKGYTVDYDIELRYEQISCIAFAHNPAYAISIPFVAETGDYFTIDQEIEVWTLIAKILHDPRIKKRGQNLIFDSHFLLSRHHIPTHSTDDTMVAQRTLMPEFPIGLDFITSFWTGHEYYKDEGKKSFDGSSFPRLWNYNGTDGCVCAEAFPKQYEELRRQGNIEAYERQVRLIEPLTYMMERGIKVDLERIKEKYEAMGKEIENVTRELQARVGWDINPNSPQQLQRLFYGIQGYKPYRDKGSITTNVDALKRLIRKGSVEAKLVQKIRKLVKERSTYLDPTKFDIEPDGTARMRCSYNPVGTRFSRLSSSENIFGTGMNSQNIPYTVLPHFLADDGYIYFSFDCGQAENRIVAYVGKIEPMIQAFEDGRDIHRLTAALIFAKPVEEISDEKGSSSLGSGEKSERDWGKTANHGLNYDFGYKSFALKYELPEVQAKAIVERYHTVYPGVRQGFHALVKKALRESRMLINLMGRRTLFMGQLNDETFKEAYSCIPQGTVGDIINEWGLEFIYYNQRQFEPVELLTQVHDQIGFQIPVSVGFRRIAEMLLMIKQSLEQPLRVHDYTFVIPADLTYGLNFDKKAGKELKGNKFPKDPDVLAQLLKDDYESMKREKEAAINVGKEATT